MMWNVRNIFFPSSLFHSPHKAAICITASESDRCIPAVMGPRKPPPDHNNPHIIEPLAADLWLLWAAWTSDRAR